MRTGLLRKFYVRLEVPAIFVQGSAEDAEGIGFLGFLLGDGLVLVAFPFIGSICCFVAICGIYAGFLCAASVTAY